MAIRHAAALLGRAVRHCYLVFGLSFLVVSARANVITSDPGWTAFPMPAVEATGTGPQTFGSPITVTWTSTNAFNSGGSLFGWDLGYGFGANGNWDTSVVMAGLNSATDLFGTTDTMTFTFSSPVSGVAGFINYVPGFSTPTTIAVWDGTSMIESFNLTFLTAGGTNQGMFLGFQESGPITSFTLTDNFIGIMDLELLPTPEPASLILLGSALLCGMALRRKLSR